MLMVFSIVTIVFKRRYKYETIKLYISLLLFIINENTNLMSDDGISLTVKKKFSNFLHRQRCAGLISAN